MTDDGERWVKFLRQYGPLPRNENMYDEHIRRSARRLGVAPITFRHPLEERVLSMFDGTSPPNPIILTGTAGDGKSHLCGQIWQRLRGQPFAWASDDIYFQLAVKIGDRAFKLHVIRDLTALPDQDERGRYESKASLLQELSETIFDPSTDSLFLLAANVTRVDSPNMTS